MVNRSATVTCGDTFCGNTIVIITLIYWHDYWLTRFLLTPRWLAKRVLITLQDSREDSHVRQHPY